MTITDLAQFRARFDACELVLLADVSTMTILGSESSVRLGQERLDEICTAAHDLFADLGLADQSSALVLKPTGTRMFVRSLTEPSEVLCGVFAPDADMTGTIDAALALLETAAAEL